MNKKILLIGGGGHFNSVYNSLILTNEFADIGVIDPNITSTSNDIQIVGNDNDLDRLYNEGWTNAFVSIGTIGNTMLKRKLYNKINKIGFEIPSIVDPSAIIANNAVIGKGVFVGKGAIINSNSIVDDGAIINTGAIVEHDCKIGRFVHLSPGTMLSGGVTIGDDSHVGTGSIVIQSVSIGNNTLIGAGSVVLNNITDNVMAYGTPCKIRSYK